MKPDYAIIAVIFIAACIFAISPASAVKLTPVSYGWDNGCGAGTYQSPSYSVDGNTLTFTYPTDALQCKAYYDFGEVVTITDVKVYYNPWIFTSRYVSFSNTSGYTQYWQDTGILPSSWHTINRTTPLTSFGHRGYISQPDGGSFNLSELEFYGYDGVVPPLPTANFTGAPLNATAPAYVAFTDLSENTTGTCTYNWSFTPTTGVLAAPGDLDNQDITMLFTANGDFTISHGVNCSSGSNISTKTDYIHIMNASALSTFRVRAVDAVSGYGINGATVSVYDIENASWTNQTTTTGEVSVTALTGHTANAYGTASGYDDGESLALPVYQGALYPIYMYPSNFGRNASAGNVTLYITVLEEGTNTRLSGMAVSLSASGGGASYTAGTTNDNGIFQVVVPNKTTYLVSVLKQKGYLGASKSVYTGTQSGGDSYVEETLWLQKDSVTPTVTATTLPGGGTPTTVQTVDPYPCVGDGSYQDTLNCQRKQGEMGADIIAYGPDLVKFFIMLTFIGGLLLIGKRR